MKLLKLQACQGACSGGNDNILTALGENCESESSDRGSIPLTSTNPGNLEKSRVPDFLLQYKGFLVFLHDNLLSNMIIDNHIFLQNATRKSHKKAHISVGHFFG